MKQIFEEEKPKNGEKYRKTPSLPPIFMNISNYYMEFPVSIIVCWITNSTFFVPVI